MINLTNIKNLNLSANKLVEILFYTFPLSFIVGNFMVSANTLLFALSALFLIKRKKLKFRLDFIYWILIAFFIYFFVVTLIQYNNSSMIIINWYQETSNKWVLEEKPILKSLGLIRYAILLIIIDVLIFNNILDLKKFFLVSLICTSFVCFDIIFQYVTGSDLFGYKNMGRYNSGPFGDELIGGSYLQKFSFFSIFYFFNYFKNNKFFVPILIFIIFYHAFGILLAGNKMPLLLFIFGCCVTILITKHFRLIMTASLAIFFISFILVIKNDLHFANAYKSFLNEINITKINKKKEILEDKSSHLITTAHTQDSPPEGLGILRNSGHGVVWITAVEMWLEQPIFGFGLKSFRVKCWELVFKDQRRPKETGCSNHPHNYYLEMLSEAGIIGLFFLLTFFFLLFKGSFNYIKNYNQNRTLELNLLLALAITLIVELWPLRSAGSFFTTWNATFFWIIAASLLGQIKREKYLNK